MGAASRIGESRPRAQTGPSRVDSHEPTRAIAVTHCSDHPRTRRHGGRRSAIVRRTAEHSAGPPVRRGPSQRPLGGPCRSAHGGVRARDLDAPAALAPSPVLPVRDRRPPQLPTDGYRSSTDRPHAAVLSIAGVRRGVRVHLPLQPSGGATLPIDRGPDRDGRGPDVRLPVRPTTAPTQLAEGDITTSGGD